MKEEMKQRKKGLNNGRSQKAKDDGIKLWKRFSF